MSPQTITAERQPRTLPGAWAGPAVHPPRQVPLRSELSAVADEFVATRRGRAAALVLRDIVGMMSTGGLSSVGVGELATLAERLEAPAVAS